MKIFASTIGLLFLLSAVLFAQAPSKEGGTLTSADKLTKMQLPDGWLQTKAAADHTFEGKNTSETAFFVVIAETRADLAGWNLERHSRGTVGKLVAVTDLPEVDGPAKIMKNGYPGLQYTIRGASNGFRVVYLHTTLETPKQYIQVLMWTAPSAFEKVKPEFDAILDGIKEN